MRTHTALCVAVLAGVVSSQTPISVESVTHVGVYDLATGTISSSPELGGNPPAVVYDNTEFLGSFFTPGPALTTLDWGSFDAIGQNEITEIEVGYATSSTSPISLDIAIYTGSTGFGDQGTLVASFALTGLPPSVSGSPEAFAITVDLTGAEFILDDGPIGYAYEFFDVVSGPLLVGPPNEVDVVDAVDQYNLADAHLTTFNFGGSPFTSLYMGLTGQQLELVPTAPARLLISEFATTPTDGEFIEIFNPNSFPVDLTDVYLTDATFAGSSTYYYQLVEGGGGGGAFGDFYARFPDGASIGVGEYQTIALNGSTAFAALYLEDPTYELAEDDVSPDDIPEMLEATPGSIGGLQGSLTNFGEVIVLLYWDGESDLVQDLDYVVYGDKVEAVDKTGVAIDGPDVDTDTSTYADDTAIVDQDGDVAGATGAHANGDSFQRKHLSEGRETRTDGNGVTGHDETSENVSFTWTDALATPNAPAADAVSFVITPGAFGRNTVQLRNAAPNELVFVLVALDDGLATLGGCPGEGIGLDLSVFLLESVTTDSNGDVDIPTVLNDGMPGLVEILIQVVDLEGCVWSNVTAVRF